jgi:outer membrane biosynthesis protein TonB
MIETGVDEDGHVTEYRIISGPQNAEVNRWIREVLSLAQFTPATAFGKPIGSKIILSFVAVRS